jgi:hypothetical protein
MVSTYSVQCGADQNRRNSDEANGCDELHITRLGDCVANSYLRANGSMAHRAQIPLENFRPIDAIPIAEMRLHCLTSVLQSEDSYLVDPASSHMLVSKIKPCMSKYKQSIQ